MSEEDSRHFLGLPVWKWAALSSLVTVIGVFGALFGIYQYFSSLEAQRAEKTLELIDRWTEEGYRDSFIDLRDETVRVINTVPASDRSSQDEQARENLRANIVKLVLNRQESNEDFEKVVYYFNYLGLCVEAWLCSQYTAKVFFDDTLLNFLSFYSNTIEDRRSNLPNYGEGIDHLEKLFR